LGFNHERFAYILNAQLKRYINIMGLSTQAANAMRNGWNFELGRYISRGFELVNKNAGGFILLTLAFFIMSWLVELFTEFMSTLFIGSIGGFIAVALGQVITQICNSFIQAPLMIGYSIGGYRTAKEDMPEVGDFFAGFSKIGPLFTTLLLSSLITLLACLPGLYIMQTGGLDFSNLEAIMRNPEDYDLDETLCLIGGIVALIPAFYFSISYAWAVNYTWFYNLSPWEALEASRKTISHNFIGALVFYILIILLMIAGLIALCIGIIYTLPVGLAANYAAFAHATGVETDEVDDFEKDFKHFDPQ
jgi:hypothetical protein